MKKGGINEKGALHERGSIFNYTHDAVIKGHDFDLNNRDSTLPNPNILRKIGISTSEELKLSGFLRKPSSQESTHQQLQPQMMNLSVTDNYMKSHSNLPNVPHYQYSRSRQESSLLTERLFALEHRSYTQLPYELYDFTRPSPLLLSTLDDESDIGSLV